MAEEQERVNEPEVAIQEHPTHWKPGQSGNPKGRPRRGDSIAELIRQKLDKDKFVAKLCDLAESGDLDAAKLVLSYIEPLAKNGRATVTAGNVQVQIIYAPRALKSENEIEGLVIGDGNE